MEAFEIGLTAKKSAGLTTFEAALALMSFVVGGGIVSIPYAISTCGLPLALVLNVTTAVLGYWSGLLYVEAKLAAPVKVMTLYELGFLALGKWSIFVVSFISVINNGGAVVLYLILSGDLAASLSKQVFSVGMESFVAQRWFWAGLLAIALLPVALKKVINEFKGMAYFLFTALIVFVLFFLREILTKGVY